MAIAARRYATAWAALVVYFAAADVASWAADHRPNIIYILADDLGYGDLSCYGQQKLQTPHIDRLAAEGLRFTAHYSGNTVCSPSRAVLMTGQHPGHCYLRGNVPGEQYAALDPSATVLPELLKRAGYVTGAFGKWGLGRTNRAGAENPLTHGFDEFYGWKSQTIAHTYYPTSAVHNGREIALAPGTFIHDLIMEHARDFIRRSAGSEAPFFCYIPTGVPHAAMHAPPALHEKWRKRLPQFDDVIGEYGAGGQDPCPPVRNPIAGFGAMMENLDNEVGRLLDLLAELGIDDTTLVMFASDNGAHLEGGHDPGFWNSTGGLRGHKRDMHEGGIRTPMLARWPGVIAPGETTDHQSAFWDVLPTLAELAGETVDGPSDGLSFVPTLRGKPQEQRSHDYLYWEFRKGKDQTLFSRAVRVGNWKAYQESGKPIELYDLERDPYEQRDLAEAESEQTVRLEAVMAAAHVPEWRRVGNWGGEQPLPDAIDGYTIRKVEGWSVVVSDALAESEADATHRALELLEIQLRGVEKALPPAAVARLRSVPIWLSPAYEGFGPTGEYHPSPDWVRDNGRHPGLAKSIEFTNVQIFDREIRRMPMMVLHELAHAYHDQVLGFDHAEIKAAYERAVESGRYDAVRRGDGHTARAYAMTDHKEYFAELSEAYFGVNDFYPFRREQLQQHDPQMHDLLRQVWEN